MPRTNTAIVMGGSIAGLLAARVLAYHFPKVLVLERDHLPAAPEHRAGAPQGNHVHVLLARGLEIIERLFPGYTAQMMQHGACSFDGCADFRWLTPAGFAPRFNSGLPLLAASRPMIEWGIRERVREMRGVSIIERVDVTRLQFHPISRAVNGVTFRYRDADHIQAEVTADLVVDCTGRGSRTGQWLEENGLHSPAETVVDAQFGYATRILRRTPGQARFAASYSQAAPPRCNRLGLAFPVEGDRWIVTLAGGGGEYPPIEEEAWLEFARTLPNPDIAAVIENCPPLGPIVAHRHAQNRLRHWDRVPMPGGLAVMGDAACAFNPVYGQGMTTAAIGAELLGDALASGSLGSFQRTLARELDTAWTLSTSEDARFPSVEGSGISLGTKLMHRYMDRVIAASTRSIPVRKALIRVMHMLNGPETLFRPSVILEAILRGAAAAPAAPQPAPPRAIAAKVA